MRNHVYEVTMWFGLECRRHAMQGNSWYTSVMESWLSWHKHQQRGVQWTTVHRIKNKCLFSDYIFDGVSQNLPQICTASAEVQICSILKQMQYRFAVWDTQYYLCVQCWILFLYCFLLNLACVISKYEQK